MFSFGLSVGPAQCVPPFLYQELNHRLKKQAGTAPLKEKCFYFGSTTLGNYIPSKNEPDQMWPQKYMVVNQKSMGSTAMMC